VPPFACARRNAAVHTTTMALPAPAATATTATWRCWVSLIFWLMFVNVCQCLSMFVNVCSIEIFLNIFHPPIILVPC
jgi:hypothetical protein